MSSKRSSRCPVPSGPGAYQLIRHGVVIYVGSSKCLRRRYREWCRASWNPVVEAIGWDRFRWVECRSMHEARSLEHRWFRILRPVGNFVEPRYRAIAPEILERTHRSISVSNRHVALHGRN